MCMCVYTCEVAPGCVYVHCVKSRGNAGIFAYGSPLYLPRQALSLNLDFPDSASLPWGILFSTSQVLDDRPSPRPAGGVFMWMSEVQSSCLGNKCLLSTAPSPAPALHSYTGIKDHVCCKSTRMRPSLTSQSYSEAQTQHRATPIAEGCKSEDSAGFKSLVIQWEKTLNYPDLPLFSFVTWNY